MSRRSILLGAGGSVVACIANGWVLEPRWICVERRDIAMDGLGPGWVGAKIALLSDTHCGPLIEPSYIERAVEITNELEPDLVLLLGDYVHRGRHHIDPGIAPFAQFQSAHGVFAVLGNHDHWDGRDQTLDALRRAGVSALVNGATVLLRRGDPLAVGGVGDFMQDVQRPDIAFRRVKESTPRILMSHNPDYAEHLPAGIRVDLMVSGHTHGGQVQVPGYGAPILPSRYGRKYQQGLVDGPRCPVYVTRGIGTISPPVRFLCRPEITLLQLGKADSAGPNASALTTAPNSGTS